ncbi:hypothetical protein BDE02_01G139800 [Populus trichocarpa]|nr:hypothetical protein BDE02_01G139800 [Populus trichocarpa]
MLLSTLSFGPLFHFLMSEYLWVLNPQGNNGMLPKLSPDQFLKLKQLTVLTLSATNKGIVKGKLNQLGRCYELQFAAGRDLMHGQLGSMIDTLGIWVFLQNQLRCTVD